MALCKKGQHTYDKIPLAFFGGTAVINTLNSFTFLLVSSVVFKRTSVPSSGVMALFDEDELASSEEVVLFMAFMKYVQPRPAASCKPVGAMISIM
jgi:hypothetical protein